MKKRRHNCFVQKQVVARCKELRLFRGVSQDEMRNDLGEMNIGRLESADFGTSLDTIVTVCDYHGITLEEFFKNISTQSEQ